MDVEDTPKILVVKLSAMGDIVHVLPAVHRLRELLPSATIHWLVSSRWAPLLKGVRGLDRVLTLDRGVVPYLSAMGMLRKGGYRLAVDLQGLLKSAVLARAGGKVVGFDTAFAREPVAAILYSAKVSPLKEHVVEQLVEVAEGAARLLGTGNPTSGANPFFGIGVTDDEVEWGHGCLRSLGLSPPFAVLLPGTGWSTKTWSPDKFARLAEMMSMELSLPSLVVWGPGEEGLIPKGRGLFVAPPTGVREMMALLALSSLVVGGDTGPLHVAAALGVPVVGLYGPTLPERNGPYTDKAEVVVKSCPHRGQHKRECAEPCVESIPVPQVFHAVRRALGRAQSPNSL